MSSFAVGKGGFREYGGSRTYEVGPKGYDSVVILIHGLGDSADGFADVADMFAPKLPKTKFVLPTAPEQPVTLNGGMVMNSWYDITGLSDRASERCDGIEKSALMIQEIMDREHKSAAVAYNRMVLAGFSQGGALSIYTGLQLPAEKKLAGILCMSGYLAGAKSFRLRNELKDTPVLHCHGTADPMVKFSWAEQTRDALVSHGATSVELRPFRGLTHSVSQEELAVALSFLQRVLSQTASGSNLERGGTGGKDLGKRAVDLLKQKDEI